MTVFLIVLRVLILTAFAGSFVFVALLAIGEIVGRVRKVRRDRAWLRARAEAKRRAEVRAEVRAAIARGLQRYEAEHGDAIRRPVVKVSGGGGASQNGRPYSPGMSIGPGEAVIFDLGPR